MFRILLKGTEGAGMSEIASCSYEARAQGVRNGCFIKDARKACPDLICLPYQFDDYRHISKEIYSILSGLVTIYWRLFQRIQY